MGWLSNLFGAPPPKPEPTWGTSEAGNATMIVGSERVTVYPDGRLWKFCVADPDDRKEPYFSDGYRTSETAKAEAIAFVIGGPSQHQSNREMREQQREEALPVRIAREEEQLAAITKSVDRAASGLPKTSTLTNLETRLRSRRRISNSLWVEAHSGDRMDLQVATDALRDGYYDLIDRVAALAAAD